MYYTCTVLTRANSSVDDVIRDIHVVASERAERHVVVVMETVLPDEGGGADGGVSRVEEGERVARVIECIPAKLSHLTEFNVGNSRPA